MAGSIGFSAGVIINYSSKPLSVLEKLSKDAADASGEALGTKKDALRVNVAGAQPAEDAQGAGAEESSGSVAVDNLLKRMKELQEMMKKQQQLLAAVQAASYPTPEAKTTAVMGIQAQIASTSAALMETSAALVKALTKGSQGSLVSTTA